MSYTVVIDGVHVVCETAADAVALAREAAGLAGQPQPRHDAANQAVAQNGPTRWTEQRIKEFFKVIKAQQRKLVDALLDTTDGLTDEQLCQMLGLADGRALAGVFTGLFKNAKKVGADPRDLYLRQTVTISDRRQFEYTLAEGFRSAAKRWRS